MFQLKYLTQKDQKKNDLEVEHFEMIEVINDLNRQKKLGLNPNEIDF